MKETFLAIAIALAALVVIYFILLQTLGPEMMGY